MTKYNRRDFLKLSTAVLGSAALGRLLAACARTLSVTSQSIPTPSLPIKTATLAATGGSTGSAASGTTGGSTGSAASGTTGGSTGSAASGTTEGSGARTVPTANSPAASPPTSVSYPDLTVARHGSPEDMTRRAVLALGGMERFVSKGANVVVKPNICVAYHGYKYAATTNPWVVATLVKMCFEAGASRVQVMDYPFGGTQQAAYTISGIKEQVEAAGGQMAEMPMFKFVPTSIPNAAHLKQANVFEDVLKADAVINVPIAKVHDLSRLTLGMKNLMGVVRDRPILHAYLSQNLPDLASLVRPKLTVIDAVRVLCSNGPTGGSLDDVKQLDTVVASPDIVAADSYATTLFGLKPSDLGYIVTGTAMGLGRSDLQNLRIEEINLS